MQRASGRLAHELGAQLRWSSSRTRASGSRESELGRHFYLNKVLEQWAARPATRMTLRQLVFFGKTLGKDRDKIIKSANYVRQELPIRIAHRIRDLQALPFVVMTNDQLEEVYNKYWLAFETLRKMPVIRTMEDNEEFCVKLKGMLQNHLTIIPSLTIGIVESSDHLPPQQLDKFMERMLRSRISRRVLAEQHIALSEALDDPFHFFNDDSPHADDEQADMGDHIGIIYTHLSVSSVVRKGIRLLRQMFAAERGISPDDPIIPEVTVDGDLGARFAYIPEHLEYIVFELLKNAMRATMRREMKDRDDTPVRVTIVEGPEEEDIIIRVSDSGGGLPSVRLLASVPVPQAVASESVSTAASDLDDDGMPVPSVPVPSISSSSDQLANDALITYLCSFSNVRRRLELERAQQQAPPGGLGARSSSRRSAPWALSKAPSASRSPLDPARVSMAKYRRSSPRLPKRMSAALVGSATQPRRWRRGLDCR